VCVCVCVNSSPSFFICAFPECNFRLFAAVALLSFSFSPSFPSRFVRHCRIFLLSFSLLVIFWKWLVHRVFLSIFSYSPSQRQYGGLRLLSLRFLPFFSNVACFCFCCCFFFFLFSCHPRRYCCHPPIGLSLSLYNGLHLYIGTPLILLLVSLAVFSFSSSSSSSSSALVVCVLFIY